MCSAARTPVSYLGIVLSVSALPACSQPESASPPAAAAQPQEVVVMEAVARSIPIITEHVGQTQSVQTVDVRACGRDAGDDRFRRRPHRRAGPPLEAALAQAKANLMQARAAYVRSGQALARARPLVQEDAVSQQELEAAIAQEAGDAASIAAAKAAIEQAELNLGYTKIRAPISGLVGTTEVRVGSLVDRSQTLLATISELDPIYVTFSIPERAYFDWVKRHPGEAAGGGEAATSIAFRLILADDSTYPHPGTFDFADRNVDPRTGTLRLRVKMPNPDVVLRPGQFVRVQYAEHEDPNAILVPQRALQEIQGKHLLYVVDADRKAQYRDVIIGARVGNEMIIEQGLKPREVVIVDGVQKIRPGAPVKPVPLAAEATPPSASASADK